MTLKDKIVSIKPRELAGPRTGKKFDYQTHWSICKVLDLHVENEDYLVVLEYHDDVLLIDSSKNPQTISFYQLKTKESSKTIPNWKFNTLKAIPKNSRNSILGKLFINFQNFQDETKALCLVSNAPFDFELEDPSSVCLNKKHILCSELSSKTLKNLKTSLHKEFDLDEEPSLENILEFEVSELILDKQEELTRNYISQFIENNFPGRNYNISPIYKALIGQFARKRNFDKVVDNYESLLSKKGISKTDIDDILLIISNQSNSFQELEKQISSELKTEGGSVAYIRRFRRLWRKLEVSMIGHDKSVIEVIQKKLKEIIKDFEANESLDDRVIDCIEQVKVQYSKSPVNQNSVDDELIEMLIIKELYEH